ncbi:unnamed protein product [Prorocentrum cordatum]|uniref:SPX domain-containing protein n=1 Tax=Prorocentrum cordatum TaxID=2364126 RepID=A0ABN9V3X8_9DINO|nr:unnamed protein product [Polarella glacialis]
MEQLRAARTAGPALATGAATSYFGTKLEAVDAAQVPHPLVGEPRNAKARVAVLSAQVRSQTSEAATQEHAVDELDQKIARQREAPRAARESHRRGQASKQQLQEQKEREKGAALALRGGLVAAEAEKTAVQAQQTIAAAGAAQQALAKDVERAGHQRRRQDIRLQENDLAEANERMAEMLGEKVLYATRLAEAAARVHELESQGDEDDDGSSAMQKKRVRKDKARGDLARGDIKGKFIKYVDDAPKEWSIQCAPCDKWHKMKPRDPALHIVHVERHCRGRRKVEPGQLGLAKMAGWVRAMRPRVDEGLAVATFPPAPQGQVGVPRCSGVAPWALLDAFKMDSDWQGEFDAACGRIGSHPKVELWKLLIDTYYHYCKDGIAAKLVQDGGIHCLQCSAGCAEGRPSRRPLASRALSDGEFFSRTCLVPRAAACRKCMALETVGKTKVSRALATVIHARIILDFATARAQADARQKFIEFKSEDGGLVGLSVTRPDLDMLKNAMIAILSNQGQIRSKALANMRCEEAWRDHAAAKHLMSRAGVNFTRANLAEGAMPNESTCQKVSASLIKRVSYLDLQEENAQATADDIMKELAGQGITVASLCGDEAAPLALLRFGAALQKCIGCPGRFALVEKDKTSGFKQDSLAKKVKFMAVVGRGTIPLHALLMRPGLADAGQEQELNDLALRCARRAAEKRDVAVIGCVFDGISKETPWVVDKISAYIAAAPEERSRMSLAGLDIKHQVKRGRNACACGATPSPSGGWVDVNINLFGMVGVRWDCVKVKDPFADSRVELLHRGLADFPSLLKTGRRDAGAMKFGKQIKRLKAINVVVPDPPKEGGAPDIRADIAAVTEEFGDQSGHLSAVARPADSRFHHLLQHELQKVNRFASLQLRTLLDTLREAHRPLLFPEGQGPSEEALAAAEKLLDRAAEELVQLEQFRRVNFTGFRKIVKKFDKRLEQVGAGSTKLEFWFVLQLQREFFIATPLDSHLLSLAWGYASVRRFRRGGTPSQPAPARKTSTTSLVKRFEVVLPPQDSPFSAPEGAGETTQQQQQKLLNSLTPDGVGKQNINSVPLPLLLLRRVVLSAETTLTYLDGPGFPCYAARLAGGGPSPAGFRLRRSASEAVGAGGPAGSGELVERDGAASALGVHAFTPVAAFRSPDAFRLYPPALEVAGDDVKQLRRAAAAVMAGPGMQEAASLGDEGCKQLEAFGREVNSMLDTMGSAQVAATVRGDRVLLRGDGPLAQGISIAVDKDLQFSLGDTLDEAVDFPYCLLEVASDSGEVSGDWLEELRRYGAMRSVEGFSIGAHAVAALHKDEVKPPDWYQNFASIETSVPPETWGLKLEVRRSTSTHHAGALAAVPASKPAPAAPKPPQPPPAALSGPAVPVVQEQSLEPKDFLASERTFLEWVSTTVMLAVMGIGLWRYSLSLGEAEPAVGGLLNATSSSAYSLGCYGLFMVLVALGFMWWAVFVHLSRVKAVEAGKAPESIFNSPNAPTVFAAAVCTTLVAQMAVKAVPLFTAVFAGSSGDSS